ncbi:MAG TPA: UDP-N-acetylmuramate--L-alanine ligase [Spirochaetia bacterium]|nr:UDP-N-acetylmuramate--L-alanine ligase [Spirochaetia bacterium]
MEFPRDFKNKAVYMVGIKGQGMTALAEILKARDASVSGSDRKESFYTDSILKRLGIPFYEEFSGEHIKSEFLCVIHSAAYDPGTNPELITAQQKGIPLLSYPEALGLLSRQSDFNGVSGVHGKTTTTALVGTLIKFLNIPATVLVGSEVPIFGNRSTLITGDRYFIAEADEYRRHFLNYSPNRVVITSIETDHLDYYKDLSDILDAFTAFALSLSREGMLIYNQDDEGAREVARRVQRQRRDIRYSPYGKQARGDYRISDIRSGAGEIRFRLDRFSDDFALRIPGEHSVYNAAAAVALTMDLVDNRYTEDCYSKLLREALLAFGGSRRRSEVLGSALGILFMDDYAHHPTAIRKTLQGLRNFYPGRRVVVDFMSHTYSRTKALLKDFATCFEPADRVILHRIYASAREENRGGISGGELFQNVGQHHRDVIYFEEPLDACEYLKSNLRLGDLFITMGAGNNWLLGRKLFEDMRREGGEDT